MSITTSLRFTGFKGNEDGVRILKSGNNGGKNATEAIFSEYSS